jgi:sodium-dependent dicarboxylate transporter 2/3/5
MPAYKNKGFFIGLIAFVIIVICGINDFIPASLSALDGTTFETNKGTKEINSQAAWFVFAVLILMAIWWATEALPVAVTSLLPLALFPLLNVVNFQSAANPYANKNIYLFLGGFILALGIENSGLHKRMALRMIISIGSSGAKLIGGFMLVAALVSMFVMNTSTTLMLLPIGLAVCTVIASTIPNITDQQKKYFDTALMIGIAYAATIGGMSTIIGTAPNLFFVTFMSDQYGIEIDFLSWMKLGIPIAFVMLISAWIILTRYVFPTNFVATSETKSKLNQMLVDLGPLNKDEIKISIIFAFAVLAWMTSRVIRDNFGIGIEDAGVAIIVAILLFVIPSSINKNTDLMQWDKTSKTTMGSSYTFWWRPFISFTS